MAVDLSDYQLEGAREFLTNLALITVGTTDITPLLEEYYNGDQDILIVRIDQLHLRLERLEKYTQDILDKEQEILSRISRLEMAVEHIHDDIRTNPVKYIDQKDKTEIEALVRQVAYDIIAQFLHDHVRQEVRDVLNSIRF